MLRNKSIIAKPPFSPPFNKVRHLSSLQYALRHYLRDPDFGDFNNEKYTKTTVAQYFITQMNQFYHDPELILLASHQTGKLPPTKSGYYLLALCISTDKTIIRDDATTLNQLSDYLFLAQSESGSFSFKRKDKKAEQLDSNSRAIALPESANLFYVHPECQTLDFMLCHHYEFICYLYVKNKEHRTTAMQKMSMAPSNLAFFPSLPSIGLDSPQWQQIGDFTLKQFYSKYSVINREMAFKNLSLKPRIISLQFLGYTDNQLKIKLYFSTAEHFLVFFKELPVSLTPYIALIIENIEIVFEAIDFKKCGIFLRFLQQFEPLDNNNLVILSRSLNTKKVQPAAKKDFLASYTNFDPFLIEPKKVNCLTYAIGMVNDPFLPNLRLFRTNKNETNKVKLNCLANILNTFYQDSTFAIPVDQEADKLPNFRKGYYPILFTLSYKKGKLQDNLYQIHDYHFLIQHREGFFSHKRGRNVAEKVDARDCLITNPLTANLFYASSYPTTKKGETVYLCVDYKIIGYLYIKNVEERFIFPEESYRLLAEIEEKAQMNSKVREMLIEFKNRFPIYPPLPEFFSEAKESILEFHREVNAVLLSAVTFTY